MKYVYFLVFLSLFISPYSVDAQTYASVPFTEGFESGSLGTHWTTASSDPNGEIWVSALITTTWGDAAPHTGTYYLAAHQAASGGGTYNLNESWLHLDLSTEPQLDFEFWWAEFNDETEVQDGVFFSDDGGSTFIKVIDLPGASYTDLQYYQFAYDLDSMVAANGLTMSSTFVIKFQQYDNYYFNGGNDGHLIDDISISIPGGGGCVNTTSSFTETACSIYTVPSGDETYTIAGTYMDTIPNNAGCDSIMTITVAFNSTASNITETACFAYTVPSGDETYTTSGMYNDTIPNTAGCDSIITIDLTINTVNYTSSQVGNALSVSATGATFQWVDCDNGNSPIAGETNSTYTATVNGNYACQITQNGCTTTTTCFNVGGGAGLESNEALVMSIYPNPNNGNFLVQLSNTPVNMSIFNLQGQLVYSQTGVNNTVELNLDVPAGMYFIQITSNELVNRGSLIIE